METNNPKDKDQEILFLRKIIEAYEKVTNLSNEELLFAHRTISAQENVGGLAREELVRATISIEELKGRKNSVTEEIMKILNEYSSNEELILKKLEELSKNFATEFYSNLLYVIANLEITEEEASLYWKEIYSHTQDMSKKMNRSVSFRVALLDHILENNRVIKNPKIIELNLFDSVLKNSVVDELTDIYNRRYFNLAIKRELKRAKRYNRPLCLLLFDVDNFKNFNDAFGHEVGDEVLRIIGINLKESFRQEDTICRVGGEEFAVILPEVDINSAIKACRRFGEKLKKNSVEKVNRMITVSGGISEFPSQGETPEILYNKADMALFKVKNSGKDNIIGFS